MNRFFIIRAQLGVFLSGLLFFGFAVTQALADHTDPPNPPADYCEILYPHFGQQDVPAGAVKVSWKALIGGLNYQAYVWNKAGTIVCATPPNGTENTSVDCNLSAGDYSAIVFGTSEGGPYLGPGTGWKVVAP